jgi:hypothetical protein
MRSPATDTAHRSLRAVIWISSGQHAIPTPRKVSGEIGYEIHFACGTFADRLVFIIRDSWTEVLRTRFDP